MFLLKIKVGLLIRARQHMTASASQLFDMVDVSKLNLKVDHPNGSTAKIDKTGNMNLSNSIILTNVFIVPDFHVNLLSVHNLCKENKCKITFDENNCYVQDSFSKMIVKTGKEFEGLYYLENNNNSLVGQVLLIVLSVLSLNLLGIID